MPAISTGTVLVTGASGFVGTYAVQALLDAGFSVRGTVRSDAKGEHLKQLSPKASYVLVPDMSKDGAYDDAVVGVDAVVHVASPLDVTNEGDPSLVIGPAVAGVTGILESLKANNPNVKRIVTISSTISVAPSTDIPAPKKFTEADWNNRVVEVCDKLGADAPGWAKYGASKVEAERAFWKFFDTNKPQFDGVALNPGLIFGPPTQFADAGAVVGSNATALAFMQPGVPQSTLDKQSPDLVDVRDVATAIVAAVKTDKAAGQRFLLTAAQCFYNDFAIAAAKVLPEAGITHNADPAHRKALEKQWASFDGSKATRVLGLHYREKDATLEATVKALAAKQKASA